MKSGQQGSSGGVPLNGSLVDCGIVLCETQDDKGNRLIQRESLSPASDSTEEGLAWTSRLRCLGHRIDCLSSATVKDESAINTPAVAAAFAIKAYEARNDNEISLEVSLITCSA